MARMLSFYLYEINHESSQILHMGPLTDFAADSMDWEFKARGQQRGRASSEEALALNDMIHRLWMSEGVTGMSQACVV